MKRIIIGGAIAVASVILAIWAYKRLTATFDPLMIVLGLLFIGTALQGLIFAIEETPLYHTLAEFFEEGGEDE